MKRVLPPAVFVDFALQCKVSLRPEGNHLMDAILGLNQPAVLGGLLQPDSSGHHTCCPEASDHHPETKL